MLSQFTIFIINSIAFAWVISVLFGTKEPDNAFWGYLTTAILVNITELILNINAAIKLRKGIHVKWWFWGVLTDLVLKNKEAE